MMIRTTARLVLDAVMLSFLLLAVVVPSNGLSQVAAGAPTSLPGPTFVHHFTVSPVSFSSEQATAAHAEHANAVRPQSNGTGTATTQCGSGQAAQEIVELARALNNDPDLIYQYVHDNVEFSPLFGALKGPVGTLLDGRGDSFDQSALMVALLNQAGSCNSSITNAVFEYGQIRLTSAQIQNWLGVDTNLYSINGVLAEGGIPATVYTDDSVVMGHVWVKVNINGVPCVFDPAFKTRAWKPGIVSSLAGIMGYTQSSFINDAGGSATASSLQGVNRTQVRNDLSVYAGNLANYLRSSQPHAGVSDVVGGGTIIATALSNGQTVRQASNPNQTGTPTDWLTIPSQFHATLQVTLPGATAQTFNSDDIYGHRLSIFFNSAYVPTLSLDGNAVISGSASSQGTEVGIALGITVPWATFANLSRTQYIVAQTNQNNGSGGYIVQTGWDQVGRGMIEKHRKLLNQAVASGSPPNSELVLGESLAVLGYTWLAEVAAQQQLSDRLLGTTTEYFYGGGIVGESVGTAVTSPYVDLPLNFVQTPARINGAATETAYSLAAYADESGTASSFESAALEQTQAQVPGFVAASTVKLLDAAVQNGDTLFDINSNNWNAISAQLAPNYSPGDLATIQSYVSQGLRVIAPLHGRIAVGAWTGVGYKAMGTINNDTAYGEFISGSLSGGFAGTEDPPATETASTVASMTPASNAPTTDFGLLAAVPGVTLSNEGTTIIGDPIDHQKGSYLYTHTDLAVGPKPFPYGLSFERSYDSGAQGLAGPLGAGWTHNFAITANVGSDGFVGMGQGTPLNAVSSLVALYVSSDLLNGQALTGQANLNKFVLETLVNRWFTDQLTQNVVNVSHGWTSEEFVKMADGSYSSQPGSATILDGSSSALRYRTTNGTTLTFNPSGQISTWNAANGASVSFSYSGSLLSTVSSNSGHQLNLSYNGNYISSVNDGVRTVGYFYTGANLTSFTDALSQTTAFSYDTSGSQDYGGHLTQVYYPSNPSNAFVTNFYDTLGRVKQQQDANGNLSQIFVAGSRTELDDPTGNRHVWYNDARGNVSADIQDYGASGHLNITTVNSYDGQSSLQTTVMPEGNTVSYSYDSYFNPLTITQLPKPGSTLASRTQTFTYTTPVSALPNYEEPASGTDPNGNVTRFTYNSGTGTLWKIDLPAVSRPGANGISSPEQVFTYTSLGLLQTSQDAEGRVNRYDYYSSSPDEVMKATVDYGRMNLVTQFTFDGYGDMKSVTDANGHVTTSHYDQSRRLTEEDGAVAGVVTKYAYYPDGQVNSVQRQLDTNTWSTTSYAYTLSDKPHTVTDPLGSVTTTAYDLNDRVQTVTEQVSATSNRQRTYNYDAVSRLYQVSDTTSSTPGLVLETHTYTLNGNQSTFVDPRNNVMTYSYDGFDRLDHTTYPDGTTEAYQYDAVGNPEQKTTRSGQIIGFGFDALNRVITKTPSNEAAGTVTYSYDYSGLLLQALDGSSANPYVVSYDSAGRPNSYTDQQGRNTQVGYDGVGNRTRLQWPAGTNVGNAYYVTYQFDAMNRMTEIDQLGSSSVPLATYQWDPLSRMNLITYGDGTSTARGYDAANLRTETQTFAGADTSVTFSYNWWNNHQRMSTTVSDAAFQFVPTVGSVRYGQANADNIIPTVNAVSLNTDANLNYAFDGTNTLAYDVENRLVQAQNQSWGTIQYSYDPLGHRKQKQTTAATTQFVLAGDDEIADYNGPGVGTPWVLTVRGVGGLPVAAITPATSSRAEDVTFYHQDARGSTVASTVPGRSGPVEVYVYDDFGVTANGQSLTYQFAGYRYDNETGLYYLRARTYSPTLGRFLQPDPVGTTGGANLYAYAANDPVNLDDPRGTSPEEQQSSANVPARLIMTFGQTYNTPTPLTAGVCPSGCYFEGTSYTYQVLSQSGTPITGPMIITEQLSSLLGNVVNTGNSYSTDGTFKDIVGYVSPSSSPSSFPSSGLSVSSQTFVFDMQSPGGASGVLSTTILQVVTGTPSGIKGTATIVVP